VTQAQLSPHRHDEGAGAAGDVVVPLQPQRQAAPGQSTQVHDWAVETFMAISLVNDESDPADPCHEFCSRAR
jgi:hypothetical protein